MERTKVLVVDDDPFFKRFCTETLTNTGLEVIAASSGPEALSICRTEPVGLVIVDIYMPKMGGIEILEEIKAHHPSIDVVVSTGYASVDTAVQALKKGASDYLRKPFAPEELVASVGNIMEQRRLYQVNEELRNQLRVYELSRSFAAVEEPARVTALGLDSLREMTSSGSGFCLTYNQDEAEQKLEISVDRDITIPQKEKPLAALLKVWEEDILTKAEHPALVSKENFEKWFSPVAAKGVDKAVLVPLRYEGQTSGLFVLFRNREQNVFDENHIRYCDFLGAQVALAFKSAARLQEAKGLAYIDSLTDLYNSRYLPIILEKRVEEAKIIGRPVSLLFLDLDKFRDINTHFGHQAGSKALIETAWILGGNVRSEDTVIRYGGDEFTVVLPNTDTDTANEIAERILNQIRTHTFLGRENKKVKVTACIGVATYPDDAKTPEMLIHLADQAMYRGKDTTRDTVVLARNE